MADFSRVLLTVDFDRTLTAPDSSIPPRNLEAIRYFMANGGTFTVNTGRSVPMFLREMGKIPVNAPFLLYNGSACYDYQTRALSRCIPIKLDAWQTLDTVHQAFPGITLEVQGVDAHYSYGKNPRWDAFYAAQSIPHKTGDRAVPFSPFLKFSLMGQLRENTVAGLFSGTPAELREMDCVEHWLRQHLGEQTEIFRSAPRIIDVQAKGISKIRAARRLQKELGKNILVCVGDAENDISMLEGADYGYCPADAVLAGRFSEVCPCAEGAVADVIYEKIPGLPENLP